MFEVVGYAMVGAKVSGLRGNQPPLAIRVDRVLRDSVDEMQIPNCCCRAEAILLRRPYRCDADGSSNIYGSDRRPDKVAYAASGSQARALIVSQEVHNGSPITPKFNAGRMFARCLPPVSKMLLLAGQCLQNGRGKAI